MKPEHFRIRIDRNTGDLWLTLEKPREKMRKLVRMTDHILLALCADLFAEDNVHAIEREVRFDDGTSVKLIAQNMAVEPA